MHDLIDREPQDARAVEAVTGLATTSGGVGAERS
jgi:hypothetical protein